MLATTTTHLFMRDVTRGVEYVMYQKYLAHRNADLLGYLKYCYRQIKVQRSSPNTLEIRPVCLFSKLLLKFETGVINLSEYPHNPRACHKTKA